MISVTLARRYARALIALSEKQKELERTQTEMGEWAAMFRHDPRVRRFFESPSISRAEKLSFLEERIKPQVGLPIYGLLHVLLRRRRLDHLVAIGDEFEKLAEQARGIRRAAIRTAVPITDGQAQEVERVLARRTGLEDSAHARSGPGRHWRRRGLTRQPSHRRNPRDGALADPPASPPDAGPRKRLTHGVQA